MWHTLSAKLALFNVSVVEEEKHTFVFERSTHKYNIITAATKLDSTVFKN